MYDAAQPGHYGSSLAGRGALPLSLRERGQLHTAQPGEGIDASYIAPAVDVDVEGTQIANNIGQGTITPTARLRLRPTL